MRRFFQLSLIGGLIAAILYLLGRQREQAVGQADVELPATTFVFDPDNIRRRITIVARPQDGREIAIRALPLDPDPAQPPPEGKGLTRLIVTVINPRVTYADSNVPLTSFSTPLELTVAYSAEDAKAAGDEKQLTLGTYYFKEGDDGGWRWQRLNTYVNPENRTLTALLYTLQPTDPVGVMV